jgi:5-methylcytosine-specific restriction endonuclease McrA
MNVPFTTISFSAEDCEARRLEQERLNALPPRDPQHPSGLKLDRENGFIDVYWGGYEYSINLDEFKSPRHVCQWIAHLAEKEWENMTPERIRKFIEKIFSVKDWDLYSDSLRTRATKNDEERAKLTPQLRWKVLKRDGYRCRACGAGAENGAVLHIDHITPISKNGVTAFNNLQTLCACCNFGKARS